jgi:methionine-R-sulfoxide reductase
MLSACAVLLAGCGYFLATVPASTSSVSKGGESIRGVAGKMEKDQITKTDEEWRKQLTPEQYHVLREKGTERAFTGKYWNLKENGAYECAACGTELFKSDTKFDSGCGWPSFYDAPDKSKLKFHDDNSFGMHRIEVTCAKCGGHLGHVFPDGPQPTGERYCINSASLNFKKAEQAK